MARSFPLLGKLSALLPAPPAASDVVGPEPSAAETPPCVLGEDPLRALKLQTLAACMRHRGQLDHPDLAVALDGVDAVFMEAAAVRAAYAALVEARGEAAMGDRMFDLIGRMVLHLGLADRIGVADIQRRYEPPARGRGRLNQILDEAERRWTGPRATA